MNLQQNKNDSLILARLLPSTEYNKAIHLKKLLKKLMPKNLAHLIKILTAPEGADCQVDEFLRLGIAAVVVNVDEAAKWMN